MRPDDLRTSYDLACYWSVFGNAERALACLRSEQVPAAHVERDPDLGFVRAHPGFRRLLTAAPAVEANGAGTRVPGAVRR